MTEEFIKVVGEAPGPTSVILVGVHGDEVCGIAALEKLLPALKINKGVVWFGYGNPRAIEANKRFVEANLNRMFKPVQLLSAEEKASYEYGRAQVIKTYLNQAGALLDIHASFTSDSSPFVICEPNAKKITDFLPVDLVVSGFDQIEPGGTDYYMNSIGKIGICLECGFLGDSKSIEIAERGIVAFLQAYGHLDNALLPANQTLINMYDLYLIKTNSFSLAKPFADFDEVVEGELIGVDGGLEVRAQKASVILFARDRNQVGEEAFLLGEKITA